MILEPQPVGDISLPRKFNSAICRSLCPRLPWQLHGVGDFGPRRTYSGGGLGRVCCARRVATKLWVGCTTLDQAGHSTHSVVLSQHDTVPTLTTSKVTTSMAPNLIYLCICTLRSKYPIITLLISGALALMLTSVGATSSNLYQICYVDHWDCSTHMTIS